MAKDSIASLNIALRATADKLSSDINRGMKGAEKSLGASATKLGVAMGLGIVAGIGTAMVGLGKVISMAFEGLDRIDALDEAASKIGLTYNAMQDLKLAAVTTGASFEGMTNAIAKMQANVSNGSAAEALQKLGLSAEYLRQLAPERQFAEIAQKLSEVKNTGDKIDLTKSIFGKGGVDILNVINGGKEGMEKIAKSAELFGGHLTDAQRAMATMAQGDIETLKEGWGYIKDQIAVGVAPALFSITESVVKFAQESGGVAKMIQGWADSLMEASASAADFYEIFKNVFRVMGAIQDADIWSANPITMYQNAAKAANAELQKILITTETAGNVIRRQYEERKSAAERAGIAERNTAQEKIDSDNAVANNFGDTTEEMTRAYNAQIEANKAKNNEFRQSFDSTWSVLPEKVQTSLDEVVDKYVGTTKTLKELTVEWVSMMIQNFLAVSNLISNVNYTSASDWWNKSNEMLQSLNSGKKLTEADGQATLDNMNSNIRELSPSEKAMAKSDASRQSSKDREAARVAANRAESRAKSDARKAGIGGSMKIGSFDGSFTIPSASRQAPSFFPGGNAKTPAMNAAARGGAGGAVSITQNFASGVTRAELAGSMDDLKDATIGAVMDAFSSGGGYLKALS